MNGKVSGTLTMNREGQFAILATGPNHCGVDENLVIKYHMICECTSKLDGRGFLFDQVNVDNYFQTLKSSTLSCEQLTIKCARKLLKLIKEENPICSIRKMRLTLSPQPFKASMTFDWETEDEPKLSKPNKKSKKFIKI